MLVSMSDNDHPGRFDVGPDENRGLVGLVVGFVIFLRQEKVRNLRISLVYVKFRQRIVTGPAEENT